MSDRGDYFEILEPEASAPFLAQDMALLRSSTNSSPSSPIVFETFNPTVEMFNRWSNLFKTCPRCEQKYDGIYRDPYSDAGGRWMCGVCFCQLKKKITSLTHPINSYHRVNLRTSEKLDLQAQTQTRRKYGGKCTECESWVPNLRICTDCRRTVRVEPTEERPYDKIKRTFIELASQAVCSDCFLDGLHSGHTGITLFNLLEKSSEGIVGRKRTEKRKPNVESLEEPMGRMTVSEMEDAEGLIKKLNMGQEELEEPMKNLNVSEEEEVEAPMIRLNVSLEEEADETEDANNNH
ncbi:unnamed protein product [Caenorhabditis auriculariae]|uniref:Uncharacterized protein n=1 Tax=Caenorhabditis auriculariae TaxID=2777116 RepID=A0A8S1HEL8_9PELO|nr:unnamed protein product [Caenorhabditis auriculariae]